jgi:hypothetical protein
MMISKFSQKVYFSPQTLHIISIQSLDIFSIQFWYKKIFLLFLIFGLREERERSLDSSGRKRNVVDTDFDHQNGRTLCQVILFDEESSFLCLFLTLKVPKNTYLSSRKFLVSG